MIESGTQSMNTQDRGRSGEEDLFVIQEVRWVRANLGEGLRLSRQRNKTFLRTKKIPKDKCVLNSINFRNTIRLIAL